MTKVGSIFVYSKTFFYFCLVVGQTDLFLQFQKDNNLNVLYHV